MSRSQAWLWVGCLFATVALAGCPSKTKKHRRGGRGKAEAVAVAITSAQRLTLHRTLEGHAALEPEAHVSVSGRVEGRVTELRVEVGAAVTSGQVLAQIDDTRIRLQLRDARLGLTQANTSLARQRQLKTRGLASLEEFDAARTAVRQAQLKIKTAELDLAETTLRSPFTGILTARSIELGGTLSPGEEAFKVADPDPLLARVRVPETQAEAVRPGQLAWVTVDGRAQPLRGEVLRVAPLVDTESGTVIVTVGVSGGLKARTKGAGVRINRFASVEIVIEERVGAVAVPQAALALRGEGDRVLIAAGEPPRIESRKVKTGVRNGEWIEILSGLEPGERIVVTAPDDLRDGTPVRVVPRKPPALPRGAQGPTK